MVERILIADDAIGSNVVVPQQMETYHICNGTDSLSDTMYYMAQNRNNNNKMIIPLFVHIYMPLEVPDMIDVC